MREKLSKKIILLSGITLLIIGFYFAIGNTLAITNANSVINTNADNIKTQEGVINNAEFILNNDTLAQAYGWIEAGGIEIPPNLTEANHDIYAAALVSVNSARLNINEFETQIISQTGIINGAIPFVILSTFIILFGSCLSVYSIYWLYLEKKIGR